ncbi:MAG: hypothetical protein KAS78_00815 [Candidatus Pacebacteria bacterium]|nr:hypothetical protein [Candidatus Paceibacterota bacterium]
MSELLKQKIQECIQAATKQYVEDLHLGYLDEEERFFWKNCRKCTKLAKNTPARHSIICQSCRRAAMHPGIVQMTIL